MNLLCLSPTIYRARTLLKARALYSTVRRKRSRAAAVDTDLCAAAEEFMVRSIAKAQKDPEDTGPDLETAIEVGELLADMLELADILGRRPDECWQISKESIRGFELSVAIAKELLLQTLVGRASEIVDEFGIDTSHLPE